VSIRRSKAIDIWIDGYIDIWIDEYIFFVFNIRAKCPFGRLLLHDYPIEFLIASISGK
jgi:hypothetical protein